MKKTLLVLPLLWVAAASASITLSTGPAEERVGKIGGLRITLGDSGFTRQFADGDRDLPQAVRLDSLTLVTRDHLRQFTGSPEPLYLKVYDSAARTTLLGESKNAFRWDVAGEVPQTYTFDALKLDTTKSYYFVFELRRGPRSEIGLAGLRATKGDSPEAAVVLGEGLNMVTNKPVDAVITLGLSRPSAPVPPVPVAAAAPVPAKPEAASVEPASSFPVGVVAGCVLGGLAIIAGVFFAFRRKRPVEPVVPAAPKRPAAPSVLPPPPGLDR